MSTLSRVAVSTESAFSRAGEGLKQRAEHPLTALSMLAEPAGGHFAATDDKAFVAKAAVNGIDVFRIFDAMNDVRNLRVAIEAVKAAGKHAQGTIAYTTSPVHTIEAFVKMGVELEKMGCHSIGIKDMSGIMTPKVAYDLVKELKGKFKALPQRSELPSNINESLVIELYSK